jgi:hypothetical protein
MSTLDRANAAALRKTIDRMCKRTTVNLTFTDGRTRAVEGYEFHTADGLPMVVHRGHTAPRTWAVTEPSTGLSITKGHASRESAMREAQRLTIGGALRRSMPHNAHRVAELRAEVSA